MFKCPPTILRWRNMPTEKQKQFQHNRPCIFKDAGGVSTRQVQCMQLLKGASLIRLSQLSIDVQAPAHNVRQVHGHASAQLRPKLDRNTSEKSHDTQLKNNQDKNIQKHQTLPAHHPSMSKAPRKMSETTPKHDRNTTKTQLVHHKK